ncbi:MAG: ABC transporter substrate-binding protein [Proteobacteria bacterium]|nr:ABC transporter substrate-binding protein [Pseudomonadota bacterium]MBU1449580.1 ABC transporter substrate-binding protein [Pseudomonadota bacterium]MBU2516877.1 ABC transporter substrate-binding protein [Pseudomonadota bacterium]
MASRARASGRDYILVGRPNPSTGPIAPFGEASPWVEERVLAEINKDGGIYIEEAGKKLPIKIKMVDTESDPTKAAEAASRLIVHDKVDLMIALHTPNTVNPVTAICERYQIPCIALDAPLENWLEGGPYKWSFHSFWSTKLDFAPVYIGMWEQIPTNKVVGFVMNNDPDGVSFTNIFGSMLPGMGYKVVDLGRFPYGHQDFSSFISAWKREKVEILLGNVIPPDWITCWRQSHQMGFAPKVATIGRATLFPSAVEALGGNLANHLATEVWWSPYHPFKSSLTGESAKGLCDAWTKATGRQWTQPIGFKYAALEIAANALKRARSLEKNKLRRAIAATDLATMVGPIKFNQKNYSRTPLVGGQWVKGKQFPWALDIVYNRQHPNIPLTGAIQPIS